jgi:hypothetical protein
MRLALLDEPPVSPEEAWVGMNVEISVIDLVFFARSTIMAVAFNGLSTITGFGTLMVAHHRGMWSLGLLLTLGSVTSLIASLVVLPVLVHLVDRASDRWAPSPSAAIERDREGVTPTVSD